MSEEDGSTPKLRGEWLWVDRYMVSPLRLLPLEARGLHREMLTVAWGFGARLPNDPASICRATGCSEDEWKRCWPHVEPYWRTAGDFLVNDDQLEAYGESFERAAKAELRAKKAADARWRKKR